MSQLPDILNLHLVLLFLISLSGITAWALFISDWVRNIRQHDPEKLDALTRAIQTRLNNLSPLRLQLVVYVLTIIGPVLALCLLAFIYKESPLRDPNDVWVLLVGFFLAINKQKAYFRESSLNEATLVVETYSEAPQQPSPFSRS